MSAVVRDIVIEPGGWWFGSAPARLHTLLGSCVAVTLWDPVLRRGGMCHFLVPDRGGLASDALDGKFGTEAIRILMREAVQAGVDPGRHVVKLFGGGNMFPDLEPPVGGDVGARNAAQARKVLEALGHRIAVEHVGGTFHRTLRFELATGDVWMRCGADAGSERRAKRLGP